MAKKNVLFPMEYDEISLVDSGAAGDAHVLIMKRDGSSVRKSAPTKPPTVPGSTSTPQAAPVKGGHKRKKSNPCNPKNSTGAKTGDSSQRAENWNEGRHPRQSGGKFGQTSSGSKNKYGNGGTTKAKQNAACRKKKSVVSITSDPDRRRRIRRRRRGGTPTAEQVSSAPTGIPGTKPKGKKVAKNSGSWDTEARLRAIMERKATQ